MFIRSRTGRPTESEIAACLRLTDLVPATYSGNDGTLLSLIHRLGGLERTTARGPMIRLT
jgi:hypothetical protein